MSHILEQLNKKPVPENIVAMKVEIPSEGKVEIKTKIFDKRNEGYDRSAFKKN